MKYEDIERARQLGDEIKATKYNITTLTEQLKDPGSTSINIAKHDDRSGWHLENIYYKGNYSEELHKNILSGLLNAYKAHLAVIESELNAL